MFIFLWFVFFPDSFLVGWVEVSWKNGTSNSYRMGADGKFDLRVLEMRSTESTGEASSSTGAEEGPSEEEPRAEEPENLSPAELQEENSSVTQVEDVPSEVLVEAVRVEDIPDEGIFTADDVIDIPGNQASVVVVEASEDASAVAADAESNKDSTSEVSAQATEEQEDAIVSEAVTEATENNSTAVCIAVGESARR